MVAEDGPSSLHDILLEQSQRPVEFDAEFLSHMKVVFRERFDAEMIRLVRSGERPICTYVHVMPGGGGPKLTAEEIIAVLTDETMPPVYVGFQYKERLCPRFRDKFLGRGLFDAVGDGYGEVNRVFASCQLNRGPSEIRVFGACPFVIVADLKNLGDIPVPRGWENLLDPCYRGKICFNETKYGADINILLYITRRFGIDALKDLRPNVLNMTHASRMCRYLGTNHNGGAGIYVMSSFFAHARADKPYSRMVWPIEGAAFQPLFIMGTRGSCDKYRAAFDYVLGAEFGQVLADNYFPVVNPQVDNRLGDNKLDWFGWNFILSNNIDDVVGTIEDLFGDVKSLGK